MGNSVPRRTSDVVQGKCKITIFTKDSFFNIFQIFLLVTDEEIVVLKRTFEDLAARNPNSDTGVDKRTFLRVFQLPGMLGERLYAVFDRKKKECVEFEDFLWGLSQIVRGTRDEKLKFLFAMYDLNEGGTIEKPELTNMLNSEVFAAHSLLEDDLGAQQDLATASEEVHAKKLQEHKERVDEMVTSAFKDFASDKAKGLTHEEFYNWIAKYPENLEVVEAVFLRHTIQSEEVVEVVHDQLPETVIEEPEGADGKQANDSAYHFAGNAVPSSGTLGHKSGRWGHESASATGSLRGKPRSASIGRKHDRSGKGSHSVDKGRKFLDEVFSGSMSALESPGPGDLNKSLTSKKKMVFLFD
jgi:Ca2+-binding EF-hand superfamily protein